MATATAISFPPSTPSSDSCDLTDQIRQRALARLYERRAAVDELIDSLEMYQARQHQVRAECVAISATAKKLTAAAK